MPFFSLGKCVAILTVHSNGNCFKTRSNAHNHIAPCRVNVFRDCQLEVINFNLAEHDTLIVGDKLYRGSSGPDEVRVAAGEKILFHGEENVTNSRLDICGTSLRSKSSSTFKNVCIAISVVIYLCLVWLIYDRCLRDCDCRFTKKGLKGIFGNRGLPISTLTGSKHDVDNIVEDKGKPEGGGQMISKSSVKTNFVSFESEMASPNSFPLGDYEAPRYERKEDHVLLDGKDSKMKDYIYVTR